MEPESPAAQEGLQEDNLKQQQQQPVWQQAEPAGNSSTLGETQQHQHQLQLEDAEGSAAAAAAEDAPAAGADAGADQQELSPGGLLSPVEELQQAADSSSEGQRDDAAAVETAEPVAAGGSDADGGDDGASAGAAAETTDTAIDAALEAAVADVEQDADEESSRLLAESAAAGAAVRGDAGSLAGGGEAAPALAAAATMAAEGGGLQPELPAAASPRGAAADPDAAKSTQPDAVHTRQADRSLFVDGLRAIDVEVDCGLGLPCRLLHVSIDVSELQAAGAKPFLGGFRHKREGTAFHNASMQTMQQPEAGQGAPAQQQEREGCSLQKLSRDTQTVQAASSSCQTVREACTQVAVPGLLLDCSGDRVLTPRPYVPAAVVEQRRAAAAQTIQRFSRGWFARKRARVLRGIKAERGRFLADTAAATMQAAQEHKRHEVERRRHPRAGADFVLLAAELEAWRRQQTAAIKAAGLQPHEEQAALQLLLAKETRLLQTLDRLRVNARHEHAAAATQQQLSSLAAPKTWALSNGKKVLVHTPLTVRAAELQQLYRGLTLSSLSLDERLDVLLHVKWAAKAHDCPCSRELVGLIDREADLLNRGRATATMDGLRRRIAGHFLSLCQDPSFNPEAARLRVNAVGVHGPETFEYVLQ